MNTILTFEKFSDWGIQAEKGLPLVDSDYICPHCGGFSYFCRGDFRNHAAERWFDAVVGFTEWPSGRFIGIAVLQCKNEKCQKIFGVFLTIDTALRYRDSSHLWKQASEST